MHFFLKQSTNQKSLTKTDVLSSLKYFPTVFLSALDKSICLLSLCCDCCTWWRSFWKNCLYWLHYHNHNNKWWLYILQCTGYLFLSNWYVCVAGGVWTMEHLEQCRGARPVATKVLTTCSRLHLLGDIIIKMDSILLSWISMCRWIKIKIRQNQKIEVVLIV